MYICLDCGYEFEYVEIVFEKHNFDSPPYERIKRCPKCHSTEYAQKREFYCRCCSAPLKEEGEYCSPRCKKLGEILRIKETADRLARENTVISKAVREVTEYNLQNGTNYSYGRYFTLKGMGKI